MSDIKILEASEVAVDEYRKLRLEALFEEPQAFGSSYKNHDDLPLEQWKEWLKNYANGNRSWMVFASYESRLVGMLGAFQEDEDITNNSTRIVAVYVTKNARGKGISKLLMKHMLQKLTNETSLTKAHLDVNKNQLPAVNLYKNFGFQIVGSETQTLGDGKEHEIILMEKPL